MVNIRPYVKANTEYSVELQPHHIVLRDLSSGIETRLPSPCGTRVKCGIAHMKFSDITNVEEIVIGLSNAPS